MKILDKAARERKARSGFALIITLIMVVLAAIIAIGLLVSASLDRTTAKSVDDRFKAEVAAQNGLEAAKKALNASPNAATSITADDSFLVVRIDAPAASPIPAAPSSTPASYYYLAKAQAGSANKIDYYPLFAGGTATLGATIDLTSPGPTLPATAVTRPTPPPNPDPANPADSAIELDKSKNISKIYPTVSPWTGAPNTKWIELHDPNDAATSAPYSLAYQRYTFWVEDLGGYVDASVAGNVADPSSANKRPLDQSTAAKRYQTTPGEIALFTIFDPILQPDTGGTGAKDLVSNRPLQYTVSTLKSIAPGPGNTDVTSPDLAARIQADSELPVVPFGYGYKDEGSSTATKLDINQQVQTGGDTAVLAITKKINDNLPNFGSTRKGGLTNLDYVKTLAASMIDYADADSSATAGADYRGYDSYPLVNEIYTMKWWTKTYPQGGTNWVEVSMDTWVELWNPSDQPISGTATLQVLENHPVQAGLYSYTFGTKSGDLTNGSTVKTTYPSPGGQSLTINMQPNEYAVFHYESDVFQFNTGVSPPLIFPAAGVTTMPLSGSLLSNYQLTWTGSSGGSAQVVDKAGGGVQRLSGSLKGPPNYIASQKRWRGSYPGFGYTDDVTSGIEKWDNPGDPRAAFYMGQAQIAIAYDTSSSFWVRNYRQNTAIANTAIYKQVKPSAWPDSGHDTALPSPSPAPGSNKTTDPPSTRPSSYAPETTKGPATISNAGSYSTIAELGNIYDPSQWNIPPYTPNPNPNMLPPYWSDITKSDITSANQASSNYGGGMTLHIGKPEFTLFDQPGTRAWQLLDLFHPGSRSGTRGLLNINTASRDALRALGAGLLLNRDPDIQPAGNRYPPFQAKQADLFANAVIAARPFLSAAQLASIRNSSGTTFFGNSATWTSSPPAEWNDSGTEEYFAKIFPLTAVHSRNFRVFVTGQSLDKSGRVLSTVNKVYQVYLTPTRDSSGKITAQKTTLTYEAQLPL